MAHSVSRKVRAIFYGWWIVAACVTLNILNSCLVAYGFSALILPLTREFGWKRAALTGAVSVAHVKGAIIAPIVGYLTDRFGPRKLMLAGLAVMGAGFIMLGRINDLIAFYIVFVLVISLGSNFGLGMPTQVVVANWFITKRSMAMGFLYSGVGLGGALVPGLVWLLNKFGWRTTLTIAGFIVWAVGLPLSLVVRRRPEDSGLLPDGKSVPLSPADDPMPRVGAARSEVAEIRGTGQGEEGEDFTPGEALKTITFWLLALVFGLSSLVASLITVHLLPFLVNDVGLSTQVAATVLGVYSLGNAGSKLIMGWIGDLVSKRLLLAACMGIKAITLLILSTAPPSLWLLIPILLLFSLGYAGAIPLRPALQAEYFGRRSFGTIAGSLSLTTIWATAAGPVLPGWIFDVTGSYRTVFLILAVLSLVATVAMLLAVPPVPKATAKPLRRLA